jgi:hypothetical protein
MRYIWLLPVLFKIQKMLVNKPFRIEESSRENIPLHIEYSQSSRDNIPFDTNVYDREDILSIKEWLEIRNDTDGNWEAMMRFGIGEA